VSPWIDQKTFGVGWHYCPTIEICQLGLEKLSTTKPQSQRVEYPDCRKIVIQ